jgi:gliding motility-associated-like protein
VNAKNDTSFSYSWSPTNGVSNPAVINPLITADASNMYVLTGKNNKGCVFYDTMNITVWPRPVLTAEADANALTCKKQSIQLSASGANTYKWSPGEFCSDSNAARTNVANFVLPTMFTVTGTDVNGCSSTTSVTILNKREPQIFVPNAFTPNDDGLNDIVFLKIYCDFVLEHFEIYDRWGQRVFKAVNANQGWDGKTHGEPADIGTYFYLVNGHSEQGEAVTLKGDITLIR